MNFDILIPTQEKYVADQIMDYAKSIVGPLAIAKQLAKEIARAKYWEAYDCESGERQEYWRLVLIELDVYAVYQT